MAGCGVQVKGSGCRAETHQKDFERMENACCMSTCEWSISKGKRGENGRQLSGRGRASCGGHVQCSSFCPSPVPVY